MPGSKQQLPVCSKNVIREGGSVVEESEAIILTNGDVTQKNNRQALRGRVHKVNSDEQWFASHLPSLGPVDVFGAH